MNTIIDWKVGFNERNTVKKRKKFLPLQLSLVRESQGELNHIQSRSHDDRFPIPLWETWFCQSLGVPIPPLLANPRQCPCRQFNFDPYSDHIQTCQRQSAVLIAHEWIVYKLSLLLRSVGHRVKPHKITPAPDNERGDIEIRIMSSCHSEKTIGSLLLHS